MSFYAFNQVYLVEKASRIALKYGLTYDIKAKVFRGQPASVQKATDVLQRWMDHKAVKQSMAEREW